MNNRRQEGFTLVELMVVVGVIAIVAAIAIPSLLRSRIAANEDSAIGTLRSLVSAEATWYQTDTDRNLLSDFWTADVSGFNRIEKVPDGCGLGVAAMDVAIAIADDNRESPGGAVGNMIPQTAAKTANLIALSKVAPKSGYYFRSMTTGQNGMLRDDPDGNGQPWTNNGNFGFQARPATYDSTGVSTFIVSETGVIWGRDCGNNNPMNADAWPGANPMTAGWRVVQ